MAAARGDLDLMKRLLSLGCKNIALETRNTSGKSALDYARDNHDQKMIDLLIQQE